MPKNENRLNRIDEELKKELSQIISYELKKTKQTVVRFNLMGVSPLLI